MAANRLTPLEVPNIEVYLKVQLRSAEAPR